MFPKHWSRRTIIMLVMQTLDNAIALRPRKGPFGSFWLSTEQDPERPNPDVHPDRQPDGRMVRQAHRRDRAELASPRRCSTSPRPRTFSVAR